MGLAQIHSQPGKGERQLDTGYINNGKAPVGGKATQETSKALTRFTKDFSTISVEELAKWAQKLDKYFKGLDKTRIALIDGLIKLTKSKKDNVVLGALKELRSLYESAINHLYRAAAREQVPLNRKEIHDKYGPAAILEEINAQIRSRKAKRAGKA